MKLAPTGPRADERAVPPPSRKCLRRAMARVLGRPTDNVTGWSDPGTMEPAGRSCGWLGWRLYRHGFSSSFIKLYPMLATWVRRPARDPLFLEFINRGCGGTAIEPWDGREGWWGRGHEGLSCCCCCCCRCGMRDPGSETEDAGGDGRLR